MAAPITHLSQSDIELIAAKVANAVVHQIFIAIGIDPTNPVSIASHHARMAKVDADILASSNTRSAVRGEFVRMVMAAVVAVLVYTGGAWVKSEPVQPSQPFVSSRSESSETTSTATPQSPTH